MKPAYLQYVNIFNNSKYTKYYFAIIDSAILRTFLDGYSESHHIIPKSLGGTDTKENLVSLTAREHFICHMFLVKMTNCNNKIKMVYAAWLMANTRNLKINSRLYSVLKELKSNNNPMKGKYHSSETRSRMSLSSKGKQKTLEHKMNISAKMRGNNNAKGYRWSEEKKIKMSKARKGKPWSIARRLAASTT